MIELGDPDSARKYFAQALTRMREISFLSGEPYPAAGLGDASYMQGDLAGARKLYEDALRIAHEAHRDDRAAEIQTALAVVAREEKRFADAKHWYAQPSQPSTRTTRSRTPAGRVRF
jgi:tetratricopeptide (TPR) repeat protein